MHHTLLLLCLVLLHGIVTSNTGVNGLYYKHTVVEHPAQSIHILTVDPHKITITLETADGSYIGSQKLSTMAQKNNAIAAVNGGFFEIYAEDKLSLLFFKALYAFGLPWYKAIPKWGLKKNSHYFSLSDIQCGIIGWDSTKQKACFGAAQQDAFVDTDNATIKVNSFNKTTQDLPGVFTSVFSEKTPHFYTAVTEYIVQNNQVKKVTPLSHGETMIPTNGYILTLPKDHTHALSLHDIAHLRISHKEHDEFPLSSSNKKWQNGDFMLASTPLLVYNGSITNHIKQQSSSFYTTQHPRTAVGVQEDGTWIFVVVDGRRNNARGFTILELAQYMKDLPCTHALNLDGGGASTMVINTTVINQPSDIIGGERPISNAFLMYQKKK